MPSFRTKRGWCRIDDTLTLESSLRGQLRRYREGSRLLFWSYVGSLLFVVGFVAVELLAGDLRTVLFATIAAVAVVAVSRGSNYIRGFTTDDEIPVAAITHVTAVEGTTGVTRPRFVVTYEDEGETRHRYVMMPSLWLSYGEDEFRRAKEAFRDAGIPVEEDGTADR
ncbi:MAG: hypothetical protein ABEI80_04050 [Haloplanus sp.]